MPLVKTYFLPLIAALILTTACSNDTPDEVRRMLTATCPLGAPSPSFKSFFLGNQMPTGLFDGTSKTLRYICQTIPKKPGVYYYSTLFDENTGIAVLSAYTVDAIQAKGIGLIKDRAHSWRVNKGIARQGTTKLYQGSKMDKGHLNPVKINSFDASYVEATFSYTNAVPQYPTWNRGLWANYEGKIADYVKRICAGHNGGIMYLMTGTSKFRLKLGPNNQLIQDAIVTTVYFPKAGNPKAAILQPNSMWTAGCCAWTNKVTGYQEAQSIAVMGNNGPNSRTTSMKLDDLQKILRNKASPKSVDLFPASHACGANSQLLP